MIVLLTEREAQHAIEAIANGVRRSDGLVQVDLPLGSGATLSTIALSFNEPSRTASRGRCSVRLSAIQFALLKRVSDNGRSSFEDLQDSVWNEETTDGAIRAVCSKLNAKLLECGFKCELLVHHGHVSLEEMG